MKNGTLLQYRLQHRGKCIIERPKYLAVTPVGLTLDNNLLKEVFAFAYFDGPLYHVDNETDDQAYEKFKYFFDNNLALSKSLLILVESFTLRHKIMKNWTDTYYRVMKTNADGRHEIFYVHNSWVEPHTEFESYNVDFEQKEVSRKKNLAAELKKKWGMK